MMAVRTLSNFASGGRNRPPSSDSIRQVFRCATARSTAARMALRPALNAAWDSCSRPPGTGTGPTAARSPAMVAATWMFIPAYPALPENRPGIAFQSQTGQTVPSTSSVPGPGDLARLRHQLGEHLADQRPEQVPAPADGGLADPEDGPGRLLGDVGAHQRDHH